MSLLDPELLQILACPETKQPLTVADEALVARLNERRASGGLKNRGGEAVEGTLDGGLLRQDGRWLYPVIDGIPVLLIESAIEIGGE